MFAMCARFRAVLTLVCAGIIASCGGGGDGGGGGNSGGGSPPGPLSIVTQPSSVKAGIGEAARFSVVASGPAPIQYQWQRDGVDVAGATAPTLSLPATVWADNQSRWSVRVSAGGVEVVSQQVTLTVTGIRKLAGRFGGYGNIDGRGTAARFSSYGFVEVDPSGGIYVGEYSTDWPMPPQQFAGRIRHVTRDGLVTTWAAPAGVAGPRDEHTRDLPMGAGVRVALGADSSTYLIGPQSIYRLQVGRDIVHLAGSNTESGGRDGVGVDARFNSIGPVAADPSGMLYVVDGASIRRVSSDGLVTTIAGKIFDPGDVDGMGWLEARLDYVTSLKRGPDGSLYATTVQRGFIYPIPCWKIRKISPDAWVSTLAGQLSAPLGCMDNKGLDGPPGVASFLEPQIVHVNEVGEVFVVDRVVDAYQWRLRKVSPQGVVSTLRHFAFAEQRAIEAALTRKRVAWIEDGQLSYVDPDGAGGVLAGSSPARWTPEAPAEIYTDGRGANARLAPGPMVLTPSGELLLAQFGGLRKIDLQGNVSTFTEPGSPAWSTSGPAGLALDRAGNLYVADMERFVIHKRTTAGTWSRFHEIPFRPVPELGTWPAEIFDSANLATDAVGNVYFVKAEYMAPCGFPVCPWDEPKKRLYRVGNDGKASFVPNTEYFGDYFAVDSDGNAYLPGGAKIFKVDKNGVRSLFAGGDEVGSSDGLGAAARFGGIGAMVFDREGNLWVCDMGNATLRRIAGDGSVTTVAGRAAWLGLAEGPLPASLGVPKAIAVGANGKVYLFTDGGVVEIQT